MVRLIFGIIFILAFFIEIVVIFTKPEYIGQEGFYLVMDFFVYLLPGILLFYFGRRYLKWRRLVGELSLSMIREKGFIETNVLAERALLSEVKVREIIEKLKKKNIIPGNVDIK